MMMAAAAAAAAAKHVVLFPFPGQGHLSAFISLAGLLHGALPDAVITLVSTPRNVAALRTTACSNSNSSFLGFHVLPFTPADHGLPPDCESSDAIQPMAIFDLFEAFEALEAAFDDYLFAAVAAAGGGGRDVCVVSDPFTAWTVTASRRHGCAHTSFASCGAYGTAILHSLFGQLPDVRPDPATGRVHLPEYPEVVIHRSQLASFGPPAVRDRAARFFGRQIALGYETDAVLINTVEEFEPTGLAMLRRTLKIPVCPIGPLVRVTSSPVSPVADADADAAIVSFLDCHPPSSVLYISFGSQNSIRAEHMTELALALESVGRPFVWVVRPPVGHDVKGEFRADQWLPDGFEERARSGNRGLLVRGWAPQVRILAHASTGAFLSHCGWNSVLESVTPGVPIMGWPLSAEQFYNAKMLNEEWGVCVEVARGTVEDTVVSRAAVADVVETVMGQTAKAGEMRRRLGEIKEVMEVSWKEGSGSSRKAMEDFVRAMNNFARSLPGDLY